jgi:hypothetical protein
MPGCSDLIATSNKVGSLGFRGTSCCVGACPAFPQQHVVICFEVNNSTTVNIEVSCTTACGANTTDPTSIAYPVGWTGISENSWGRSKRTVRFDQFVQSGSFIRITTCANVGSCSTGVNCGLGVVDTDPNPDTYPDAPKLLQFRINGQDIVTYLQAVRNSGDQDGCVYVGCADRAATEGACCLRLESLQAVPWGTEILVGPIGERAWVLGCPNIIVDSLTDPIVITTAETADVDFSVTAHAVRFVDPALTYFWEVRANPSSPSSTWEPYVIAGQTANIGSALTDTLIISPIPSFIEGTWDFRCNIYSTIGNSAVVSEVTTLTVTAAL